MTREIIYENNFLSENKRVIIIKEILFSFPFVVVVLFCLAAFISSLDLKGCKIILASRERLYQQA